MTQDLTKQHIERLREVINNQKCMLMVGYGLSSQVHPEEGYKVASNWADLLTGITGWCLLEKLIDNPGKIAIDNLVKQKRYASAQVKIDSLLNSPSLRKHCLSHVLLSYKARVCEAHRSIARLSFRAYFTTNYDTFIEDAFLIEKGQAIVTLYDTEMAEALGYREKGQQFVLKLCGDIYRPDLINLLDLDLKRRFKDTQHPLVKGESLQNLLSEYHLLCIGFQQGNPDLACLEHFCKKGIFGDTEHWIAVPQEHKLDFVTMSEQSKNIHIVTYPSSEGLEGFLEQLEYFSSKQSAYIEKNKQEKSEQRVLETVANGEHSQNNTIQSPPQRNLQEDKSYDAAPLDKGKGGLISYVDFTLQIDTVKSIKSLSEQGQYTAKIKTAMLENIQLRSQLIEANKTNEESLKELGIKLYQMIFLPDIDKHFKETEAAARTKGRKVRIRLHIESDTLAVLPWEFLYRKEGGYFLAVNPDTVLARYLDLPLPLDLPPKQAGPLHLLIIIANPADQTPLDPDEWEGIILQALEKLLQKGLITVRTVKQATHEQIRDALLEHKPDMIQFVGHGIYYKGKGYLALVDSKTGQTWEVDESRFANFFLGMGVGETLRLLSLATCESAKSDSPRGFLGIAPQIVQRGVPIVVAMQYSVLISTAEIYLENFYTAVAAHRPVDWAVQYARNATAIKKGLDNREFGTPVLYMRATDGNIF